MFVLLHSPLVGAATWSLVGDHLRHKDIEVIIPTLVSSVDTDPPYWQQHVRAVARALEPILPQHPLILVGHSGAGMLLPALRQVTRRPVAAYLFVDAGLPQDGKSRLDLFENPDAIEQFRQAAVDNFLPPWSADDLRDVIPDMELRQRFVAELSPLPLAVYEEPIPVFTGWPDAPCGYLRFGSNPVYESPAEQARREGWAYLELEGEHFHMLVDPLAVANTLLKLLKQLGVDVAYLNSSS